MSFELKQVVYSNIVGRYQELDHLIYLDKTTPCLNEEPLKCR